VQAWSVEDPEWACKIDENPAGIKACRCVLPYAQRTTPMSVPSGFSIQSWAAVAGNAAMRARQQAVRGSQDHAKTAFAVAAGYLQQRCHDQYP
jgi:primosomal replication protein N